MGKDAVSVLTNQKHDDNRSFFANELRGFITASESKTLYSLLKFGGVLDKFSRIGDI